MILFIQPLFLHKFGILRDKKMFCRQFRNRCFFTDRFRSERPKKNRTFSKIPEILMSINILSKLQIQLAITNNKLLPCNPLDQQLHNLFPCGSNLLAVWLLGYWLRFRTPSKLQRTRMTLTRNGCPTDGLYHHQWSQS